MNLWHPFNRLPRSWRVPVLLLLFNERLLPWVLAASAATLYGTAVWTVFSDRPAAGLFYFTQPTADILLHLLTGTIFLVGALIGFRALEPQLS